jgi:hypothetical protein
MAKNAIETVAREDKVCTLMPHASLKRFGTEERDRTVRERELCIPNGGGEGKERRTNCRRHNRQIEQEKVFCEKPERF